MWNENQAAEKYQDILNMGFDAVMSAGLGRAQTIVSGKFKKALYIARSHTFFPMMLRTDYSKVMRHYYVQEDTWENVYPTLLPQWDRTPRAGIKTDPLTKSTPEKFQKTVEEAINLVKDKQPEHQILFLKAWNEWGEGNYVEPDQKYGHGWLNAIRNAINKSI